MEELNAAWIAEGDEQGLEEARRFALEGLLDRAWLYASLECPPIRKRSRLLHVRRGSRLEGLASVVDGVFPFRAVPLCALLPGATPALLARIDPPFVVLAPQPAWHSLQACGGLKLSEAIQMARMHRVPAPERDPRVQPIERVEELQSFLGPRFAAVHFEAGPFLGIREAGGLAACGGVELVTDRVAQLAYLETRDGPAREELLGALLAGLIRELETDDRRLLLELPEAERERLELYARFGFRGRIRMGLFRFEERVRSGRDGAAPQALRRSAPSGSPGGPKRASP